MEKHNGLEQYDWTGISIRMHMFCRCDGMPYPMSRRWALQRKWIRRKSIIGMPCFSCRPGMHTARAEHINRRIQTLRTEDQQKGQMG
eukprot:6214481-Pleurochrysis_carterae.AAC.2